MPSHFIRFIHQAFCLAGTLIVALHATAHADASFLNVPARFQTRDLSVGSRALGEICYSRDIMPDGTVCNPAYLPDYSESLVLARVFVGNGYSALNSANQFLNQPLTQDYLKTLFQQQNASAVEADAGLYFTTRFFQASYEPYRVQYASEVHNPNDPEVSVNAAIEQRFSISTGTSLIGMDRDLRDFSVGISASLLQRKFVHSEFSLLDVATLDTSQYLPIHQQNAVLVNPVIAWIPAKNPWKLRVSLGITNVGFSSAQYAEYPNYTDFGGGIGIEPPLPIGHFRFGIDFTDLIHAAEIKDRVRVGTSYQYGLMEIMAGINSSATTFGLSFLLSFVQASLVYQLTRDDLETGNQETRVATEFSVRL